MESALVMLALVVPAVAVVLASVAPQFPLVKLPEYVDSHGARCLDGSPASFYIQSGAGFLADSFIIDFEGGGWCYGSDDQPTNPLPNCAARARSFLGSSNGLAPACSSGLCNGFLAANPATNPDFGNWSKVFVNYW